MHASKKVYRLIIIALLSFFMVAYTTGEYRKDVMEFVSLHALKPVSLEIFKAETARMLIANIGEYILWHIISLTSLAGIFAAAFSLYKNPFFRFTCFLVLTYIFWLSAKYFMVAETDIEFLKHADKIYFLEEAINVKLGSLIVALISGGLTFETFKVLIMSEPPEKSTRLPA